MELYQLGCNTAHDYYRLEQRAEAAELSLQESQAQVKEREAELEKAKGLRSALIAQRVQKRKMASVQAQACKRQK